MKLQNELKELGKNKIKQWRTVMDELDVQLALGKVEVKDMLNKEKQNLSAYIEKQNELFRSEEKAIQEEQKKLKTQLEDLIIQMQQDIPNDKRSFEKNKKESLKRIHELEYNLKMNSKGFHAWLGRLFDDLKEAMDEYRIQLAVSSFESQEEMTETRKEFQEELQKSIEKLTKEIYPEERKVNHFIHEVSASLDHLKRAFSDILD